MEKVQERDPFGPPKEFDSVTPRMQGEALNDARRYGWKRVFWFELDVEDTMKGSPVFYSRNRYCQSGRVVSEPFWIQELDEYGNIVV